MADFKGETFANISKELFVLNRTEGTVDSVEIPLYHTLYLFHTFNSILGRQPERERGSLDTLCLKYLNAIYNLSVVDSIIVDINIVISTNHYDW